MAMSCSALTAPPPSLDACYFTDYVESVIKAQLSAHVITLDLDPEEFTYLPMPFWRPLDGAAGCAGTVRRSFFPMPDYAVDAVICTDAKDFDYRITPTGAEPLATRYDDCRLMLGGRR